MHTLLMMLPNDITVLSPTSLELHSKNQNCHSTYGLMPMTGWHTPRIACIIKLLTEEPSMKHNIKSAQPSLTFDPPEPNTLYTFLNRSASLEQNSHLKQKKKDSWGIQILPTWLGYIFLPSRQLEKSGIFALLRCVIRRNISLEMAGPGGN